MKYFIKEELEDITRELIENPTRETLRRLNEKYNGTIESPIAVVTEAPEVAPSEIKAMEEPISLFASAPKQETEMAPMNVETQFVEAPLPFVMETPVVAPIPVVPEIQMAPQVQNVVTPNANMPTFEMPVSNLVQTEANPSIELPKLETPTFNNVNNAPINFSGNLFETPMTNTNNLMQTTENFNMTQNTAPSTEISVSPAPFFISSPADVNNPIPVGGSLNTMPVNTPTMFGQLEQNYM